MKKAILLLTITSIVLIMGKNRRNRSKVPKLGQPQPKGTKLERLYERLESGLIKVGNKWVPMNNDDINKIKSAIATLEDKAGIKR